MHAILEIRKKWFVVYIKLQVILLITWLGIAREEGQLTGNFLLLTVLLLGPLFAAVSYLFARQEETKVVAHELKRLKGKDGKLYDLLGAWDNAEGPLRKHTAQMVLLGRCVDALNAGVSLKQLNALLEKEQPGWSVRCDLDNRSEVVYQLYSLENILAKIRIS